MARYIDADQLYALVDKAHEIALNKLLDTPKTLSDGELNPMYIRNLTLVVERAQFKEEIFDAPIADVVERKRGKWETEIRTIRGHKIPFPFCSVCGKYTIYAYSYCPNCGAEMERSE